MIRSVATAFVLGLLWVGSEAAKAASPKVDYPLATHIAPSGKTTVPEGYGVANVKAVVTAHVIDIGKPSDALPDVRNSNCTYSRYPCSIVDRLDIFVNGKPISVPRSVFSDLADLNKGHFQLAKRGLRMLVFDGGDASEAYNLKIAFDDHRVLWRRLASIEFPQDFEATTYVLAGEPDE